MWVSWHNINTGPKEHAPYLQRETSMFSANMPVMQIIKARAVVQLLARAMTL